MNNKKKSKSNGNENAAIYTKEVLHPWSETEIERNENELENMNEKLYENEIDTRSFSNVTKSQLLASRAIEKTIKNTIKPRLLSNNSVSSSFGPTNSSSSLISGNGSCSSLDLLSNNNSNSNNYGNASKILKPTSDLIAKFWKTFEKFAVSQSGKLGQQRKNNILAMTIPVSSLYPAIQLMSTVNIEAEIHHIITMLGFTELESLSWVEYRDICLQLFQSTAALPTVPTTSLTMATTTTESSTRSHSSPSRQSHSHSPSPSHHHGSEYSVGSQPYDHMIRVDRTANTIPHSVSQPSLAESCQFESTPSLKKDSLCRVLKQEYRKIRKAEDIGASPSILESIPSYQRDLQKKKIVSILNPSEGRPKKWRQVRQSKISEEAKIQRLAHRNALIQHLKTVVVAQDRTGLNKALLAVDLVAEEAVDRNMERRYEEKLKTAHNIETRSYTESLRRAEEADTLKHTLRESAHRSRLLINEEKSQRFHALNSMNDSLFTESRTLSSCTSSKFEVPIDIKNRIQYSKKLSEYKKARQDAKRAYEDEISNRINSYTAKRKEAQMRAESTGCLISLRPLNGSDYFQAESSNSTATTGDPYNDEYFDSSQFLEHLQIGERSGILTAPVLLDPNLKIFRNMTDTLDSTRVSSRMGG